MIDNLSATSFDVACLQETNLTTCADLAKVFQVLGPERHPAQNPEASYGNALLYNPQTMRVEKVWALVSLSRPERRAIAALFTHLASGKTLAVASVHLKGYDPTNADIAAREREMESGYDELRAYINQLEAPAQKADSFVVAGDFNEDPTVYGARLSRAKLLENAGYAADGDLTPSEPHSGRRIDWIFAKGAKIALQLLSPPHPAASDHLCIGSRLTF